MLVLNCKNGVILTYDGKEMHPTIKDRAEFTEDQIRKMEEYNELARYTRAFWSYNNESHKGADCDDMTNLAKEFYSKIENDDRFIKI